MTILKFLVFYSVRFCNLYLSDLGFLIVFQSCFLFYFHPFSKQFSTFNFCFPTLSLRCFVSYFSSSYLSFFCLCLFLCREMTFSNCSRLYRVCHLKRESRQNRVKCYFGRLILWVTFYWNYLQMFVYLSFSLLSMRRYLPFECYWWICDTSSWLWKSKGTNIRYAVQLALRTCFDHCWFFHNIIAFRHNNNLYVTQQRRIVY